MLKGRPINLGYKGHLKSGFLPSPYSNASGGRRGGEGRGGGGHEGNREEREVNDAVLQGKASSGLLSATSRPGPETGTQKELKK